MNFNEYAVSVIVPVYNRERIIVECAKQLMNQSLKSVEYIFINDGSYDNTFNNLKRYIENTDRVNDVKIINLPQNMGVANARKVGMLNSTGKYIIHCDSDDYFIEDALERMYLLAEETNSDFVVCGSSIATNDGVTEFIHSENIPKNDRNASLKATIDHATLWSHLVRKSFIDKYHIYPIEGINNLEDLLCIIRYYHYAERWSYVRSPLYYYNRTFEDCLTKNINMSVAFQMKKAYDIIEQWNSAWHLDLDNKISDMKIYIRDCMYSAPDFNKKVWMSTYPDVKRLQLETKKNFNKLHYLLYYLAIYKGIVWPLRLLTIIIDRFSRF